MLSKSGRNRRSELMTLSQRSVLPFPPLHELAEIVWMRVGVHFVIFLGLRRRGFGEFSIDNGDQHEQPQ
jgi:hypothetical protein